MKKCPVIHPFFFAVFPVLFLFSHNIAQMSPTQIVMPAVTVIFITALLKLSLGFILKNKKKAGLIVSLLLLLFFSYGHFYHIIGDFRFIFWGIKFGTNKILFFLLGLFFLLAVYSIIKTGRKLHNFTGLLNIAATCLVVMSLVHIGVYKLNTSISFYNHRIPQNAGTNQVGSESAGSLPNIYYIILDGYARADIIKKIYEYENNDFLDYLSGKGFYIANRSRSNYCQTTLSLASSLSLRYLNGLAEQIGVESDDRTPLRNMIRNNRVFDFLKQYGYVIVAFASGYYATEIKNADIYIASGWFLDEFQNILMSTTPIPVVLSYCNPHNLARKKILRTFDHLVRTTELGAPIFVFAHIIAPHPPFVFGRHGEEIDDERMFFEGDGSHFIRKGGITRDEYVENYREQLIFINYKIKTTIDGILSKSTRRPIIILQSDHGPGSMLDWEDPNNTNFKERFSILNAIYLPNDDQIPLYDEITPVNTFRLIFNHYFGTNYGLLKDESYFSTWHHPYKFINVTDKINCDTVTRPRNNNSVANH